MSTELLRYTTYGGWSPQRPAHGTMVRFSQEMVTLRQDGRTFRLGFKFDRASYQLFRAAMVDHQHAMDDSLLCPSWSGTYNAPAKGRVGVRPESAGHLPGGTGRHAVATG